MAKKVKTKWSKDIPTVEGWYWMKYSRTVCPGYVTIFRGAFSGIKVQSARNDSFVAGPNHGGWKLKWNGKPADVRFGPKIEEPN